MDARIPRTTRTSQQAPAKGVARAVAMEAPEAAAEAQRFSQLSRPQSQKSHAQAFAKIAALAAAKGLRFMLLL